MISDLRTMVRGTSMRAGGLILIVASIVLYPAVPWADDQDDLVKVRIEASAPGTGPTARNAAVQGAERDMAALTLKAALTSELLAAAKPILDKANQYIRSVQLIRYETVDGATRVEVEGFVRRKELLKDAAAFLLPRMTEPPKVLVLIAEPPGAGKPVSAASPGTAGKAIEESLKKASLDVVDSSVARACYSEADLLKRLEGGNEEAGALAKQQFADVAVLGALAVSSESQETNGAEVLRAPDGAEALRAPGGGVAANKATLSVRVFRARDGKLVEALSAEAIVHSLDAMEGAAAAIEDVSAKLAPDLETICVLAVAGLAPSGDTLITVEQPGTRGRFDELVKAITEICGGTGVEVLFYSDSLARMRIDYQGLMTPLLDTLEKRTYDGRALETRRAVQHDVTLRLAPGPPLACKPTGN